jgi:hypothetical protein
LKCNNIFLAFSIKITVKAKQDAKMHPDSRICTTYFKKIRKQYYLWCLTFGKLFVEFQVLPAQILPHIRGQDKFPSKKNHIRPKLFSPYMYLCFLKLRNRCFISSNKSEPCSILSMRSDLSLLSSLVSPGGSLEACNLKSEFVLKSLKKANLVEYANMQHTNEVDGKKLVLNQRQAYLSFLSSIPKVAGCSHCLILYNLSYK